ncbi:MAG TPA: 3-hydroxyacyl-CoA dehydrogenase [Rhodospirillaceae bacterium]|nr:3-hydroxyacyl-CoA dehydrogenase [Rhodospirillaceae bacterium]MAX64012.1 3-hydroxyacyl-CoA dehydrogenase [Rhodospirillaceae bacterium]MBB58947.1 3-hydroxyacyl-CoA dehydrogenase [Rhodospirillaceae bacterium]HAE03948.1 3-hydroxyacyl-CoA dehydrogenase [Rhodospirillaceae bacterium]|tara:strand:- start:32200 stop:34257 length:2058 start_codon:yes stop_codon:yes gene_type:complete
MSDLTRLEQHGRIAVIVIENPPVNAMSPGVPGGLIGHLRAAEADDTVAAIVLMGGGRGLIGGADIAMFGKPWPEGEPTLHTLIAALDACPKPTIAALQAHTLGGGLEIAMSCHYRILGEGGMVGQPEVNLGIPPGAGGTQRLPRLAGIAAAADMIISGKPVGAKKALELGIVDRVVSGEILPAALSFADEMAQAGAPIPVSARPVEAPPAGFFETLREQTAKRAKGMRAPLACLDCVEASLLPFPEGSKKEREIFQACVASEEAAALRHMFFAERAATKIADIDPKTPSRTVKTVAVIGAGTMGGGIAIALLDAGYQVMLLERAQQALDAGCARIDKNYQDQVAKGRLKEAQRDARLAALKPVTDIEELAAADLVIEAVFEDLAVKREIFATLARVTKPGTILATNTSYIDVNEIATAAGDRVSDVLGMHFFSPANIMKLLEIVRAEKASPEALTTALAVGKKLGKTPVVAGVCDGFIGNRIYNVYRREAIFLMEEGASPMQVDRALTNFGMALGPFAVMDLAGLDIAWAQRKATAHLRDPNKRYCTLPDRLCEMGRFGQKTGRGFYLYEAGNRKPVPDPNVEALAEDTAKESGITRREITDQEIVERCLYALVNESCALLHEGIAQRASDVDVVFCNGYGFPRQLGGPMFWAERIGFDTVLAKVTEFSQTHDFWEPSVGLKKLV